MCDLGCDETGTAYGHGKVPKGQGCSGMDATPSGANFAAPPLATRHTKRSGGCAVNMRAFSWQCMDLMASWAFEPLDHSREFSQVDVRECSLDPSVPCVPWAGLPAHFFARLMGRCGVSSGCVGYSWLNGTYSSLSIGAAMRKPACERNSVILCG